MIKQTKKIAIGLSLIALAFVFSNTAEAKTLSVGSTGSDVVKLQTFLIDNGYTIPLIEKGAVSKGYFGEQTENAVKMYQEDNETYPTGSIDSSAYAVKSIKLGAVTSPDFSSPYFSYGGARFWAYSNENNLVQATTTPCAIQFSTFATTTLQTDASFFRLNGIATSTGPVTITMAKGATPYATTSLISQVTIQASKSGAVVASTTATNVANLTFSPSEYLVFGIQGSVGVPAGAGTFSVLGKCQGVASEN
jgi:peptidoglycan hydrolase-like protein with peptidoglycan-binding domain